MNQQRAMDIFLQALLLFAAQDDHTYMDTRKHSAEQQFQKG